MVHTCYYIFVWKHRMYNTKNEPSRKLWTWNNNDTSVYVHSCNKCTTRVGDADSGGGHACVGGEGMKSLAHSSQSCCEP